MRAGWPTRTPGTGRDAPTTATERLDGPHRGGRFDALRGSRQCPRPPPRRFAGRRPPAARLQPLGHRPDAARTRRPTSPTWPSTRPAAPAGWDELAETMAYLRSIEPRIFTIVTPSAPTSTPPTPATWPGSSTGSASTPSRCTRTSGQEALRALPRARGQGLHRALPDQQPGCRRAAGPRDRRRAAVGGRGHARARRVEHQRQLHARGRVPRIQPSWRGRASSAPT